MRASLRLHPDSRSKAVRHVDVEISRRGGALAFTYIVTGAIDEIIIPSLAAPERADGLWRTTCFEAFARATGNEAYIEFNFAPSTQWAAYGFGSYRAGMELMRQPPPRIVVNSSKDQFELVATMDDLPGAAWRLGLSAVIEETGGEKSYWALAHAPGKADFHHADNFALDLAAPERT
jgi:hypothetical protein